MLRRWLFEGELQDPHGEFFVQLGSLASTQNDPSVGIKRGRAVASVTGTLMWHRKYTLRTSMLPSWWISTHPDMASRILLIGKSLNFIRQTCKDSEWVLDVSNVSTTASGANDGGNGNLEGEETGASATAGEEFEYGNNDMLMRTVERALSATNARLLELIFKKYNLVTHLSAIKRYSASRTGGLRPASDGRAATRAEQARVTPVPPRPVGTSRWRDSSLQRAV